MEKISDRQERIVISVYRDGEKNEVLGEEEFARLKIYIYSENGEAFLFRENGKHVMDGQTSSRTGCCA